MIPKKKKTPEEIAKLRESLGLPGADPAPAAETEPPLPAPEAAPAPAAPEVPVSAPLPQPAPLPVQAAAPLPETPQPAPVAHPPTEAKPVRSLRKSERVPLPKPAPSASGPDSILPSHRHSEIELNQMRRAAAFENRQAPPATHLLAITANPFLVGLGYAFAFSAAFMPLADYQYWFKAPFALTASLAGLSLLVAAFIFLKKKRSVHNACFIAAIAFFTLVFSALYYFPQLRNAS
ncbi:MAG TPA: hypothetical protein VM511_13445 [Luteolibacter sp.]|nr:hypothetical protein [Luteolibacter sp.]